MVLLLVGVISKFADHTTRKSLWWAPGTLSNCESEVTVQREKTLKNTGRDYEDYGEEEMESMQKLVKNIS